MSISALAQRIAGGLLSRVLPQSCLLCAADSGGALLCRDCMHELPRPYGGCCPTCALPTPQGETCGACLKRRPHFGATVAAFFYAFPVDRLVQHLKYSRRLAIADFFAAALLPRLDNPPLPRPDIILPLPLSPRRLRERGFNQAVEIARPLARALGVPLDLDSCQRVVDTVPQTMLPWKERRKNVRHAFACTADLSGKSIIVVDDVMTTGATLDEFSGLLKDHGAAHVACVVAARTVRNAA